jgi:hypothetical protein
MAWDKGTINDFNSQKLGDLIANLPQTAGVILNKFFIISGSLLHL